MRTRALPIAAFVTMLALGIGGKASSEELAPTPVDFHELLQLAKQWEDKQSGTNLRFSSEEPAYSLMQHFGKGGSTLYATDNVGPEYLPNLKGSYYGYWQGGQAGFILEKTGLKISDTRSSADQTRYLFGTPSDKIEILKSVSKETNVLKGKKTYIVAFEIDSEKQIANGLFNILPLPSWPYNSYQFHSFITYFFSDQGRLERILGRNGPFVSSVVVSTSDTNPLAEFESKLEEIKSVPPAPFKTIQEAMLQQLLSISSKDSRANGTVKK